MSILGYEFDVYEIFSQYRVTFRQLQTPHITSSSCSRRPHYTLLLNTQPHLPETFHATHFRNPPTNPNQSNLPLRNPKNLSSNNQQQLQKTLLQTQHPHPSRPLLPKNSNRLSTHRNSKTIPKHRIQIRRRVRKSTKKAPAKRNKVKYAMYFKSRI